MDTEQIMDLALRMARMKRIPADSGIHLPGTRLQKALVSIDVTTSELLLAKQLGCDVVIGHHPLGKAVIGFPQVLDRHVDFMARSGVPRKEAQVALKPLKERLEVTRHPANYQHILSAAKEMAMPLMNIHLPLDEIGRQILQGTVDAANATTVSDLVHALSEIPEFKRAETRVAVALGSPDAQVGKVSLVFAAGTNGGYSIAKAYFRHGTNTLIYLHIDYEDLRKLREDGVKGTLLILGHIAGDSIGINRFNQELRRKGMTITTLGVLGR